MCNCDLERPAIFEQVARKARKQHKCCECNRVIKPSETYVCTSGLWEGKWSNYKHCSDCELLANKFMTKTECCYSLGSLYQELLDSDLVDVEVLYDDSKGIKVGHRYFSNCDWLEVVSQKPLRIVVKPEANIKAA